MSQPQFELNLKLTKPDKDQIDNLIRILAKMKLEMQGVEILAAANAMRWLSSVQAHYEQEHQKSLLPPPPPKVTEQPLKPVLSEVPKTLRQSAKKKE
jgi:hypothetical protein